MKKDFFIFFDFTKKLFRDRYLLWMLTIRELKASYVGSLFGFAWAIFNPLFLLAIYGIVFGVFFKSKPDPTYGTDSFLFFLLCGIVPWQFFAQTLSASTETILSNKNLVKRSTGFPSEVLPVTNVFSNLVSHFIGIVLLMILLLFGGVRLNPAMPLIFVYLFFASVFTVGLAWILASANVFLRDIGQILNILIMGMFFMIPIVYPASFVPPGHLFVLKLNPIFHFVEGYRYALLAGHALPPLDLAYFGVVSFVTFGIGGVFFRRLKPLFAEML
ncbi:MAG: ABC transporter permease [Thermodesulfobacteriota bacterium]